MFHLLPKQLFLTKQMFPLYIQIAVSIFKERDVSLYIQTTVFFVRETDVDVSYQLCLKKQMFPLLLKQLFPLFKKQMFPALSKQQMMTSVSIVLSENRNSCFFCLAW